MARSLLALKDVTRLITCKCQNITLDCSPYISSIPINRIHLIRQVNTKSRMSTYEKHIFPSEAEKEQAFAKLVGWDRLTEKEAIKKVYNFKNFVQAFSFMTAVALESEKLDHHPEWFNVYNRVEVVLNSHFCNGLSRLDLVLATKIDEIYQRHESPKN